MTKINKLQTKKREPLQTNMKGLKNDHKDVTPTKNLCQQIPVERNNTLETIQQSHNLQPVKAQKSIKSITKPRPQRECNLRNIKIKKSGLWKLGDKADKELRVNVVNLNLSEIQCPICNKFYSTPNIRQKHECHHLLPGPSTDLSVDSDLSQDSKEQQEFLICLNLVRKQNQNSIMNKLAKRSDLLKSLNTFVNNLTSYNCHLCEYKTSKRFIMWAHMSTFHMNLNTDEKTCSFCFLCERVLNRRVKLHKHLVKCKENKLEDNISSSSTPDNFICYVCKADDLHTLSELENHLWSHVNE